MQPFYRDGTIVLDKDGRSALPLGLSKNCYYIGKNPLYATGVYRQRMEGVFVKARQQ